MEKNVIMLQTYYRDRNVKQAQTKAIISRLHTQGDKKVFSKWRQDFSHGKHSLFRNTSQSFMGKM